MDLSYYRGRIRGSSTAFSSFAEFLDWLGASFGGHEITFSESDIPGTVRVRVEEYGDYYVGQLDDLNADQLDDLGGDPVFEDSILAYGYWERLIPGRY